MPMGSPPYLMLIDSLCAYPFSAITHGISHLVGQVAVGTLADLVLWKPENFGAKPEMVIKSGVIAWAQVRPSLPFEGITADASTLADSDFSLPPVPMLPEYVQMGDANASIPTVQPFIGRPMWGSFAASAALNSVSFVSEISISSGTVASYGLKKRFESVKGCRKVTKKDMKWNGATPAIKVDPESYEVRADGELMDIEPATKLPLARYYNIF